MASNHFVKFYAPMRCVGIFLLMQMSFLGHIMAAGYDHPAGARSAGMAHASVAVTDLWCFDHNQAGLAYIENLSLGFFHQSGYVPEMDHQALALLVPVSSGALAGSYTHYGYKHYHESKAALAYGRCLAKNLAAGIQLDYFHTRISGIYGSVHQLTFEVGVHFRINEQWSVATHLFNPLARVGEVKGKPLPVIFRLGAAWKPSLALLMLVEVEKDLEQQAIPKLAAEYELIGNFHLRTGVSLNPALHCFGLGYAWKGFQVDLAFSFHPTLGRIPNFALSYAF